MTAEHQTSYLLLRTKAVYLVPSEPKETENTIFLITLIVILSDM